MMEMSDMMDSESRSALVNLLDNGPSSAGSGEWEEDECGNGGVTQQVRDNVSEVQDHWPMIS